MTKKKPAKIIAISATTDTMVAEPADTIPEIVIKLEGIDDRMPNMMIMLVPEPKPTNVIMFANQTTINVPVRRDRKVDT